MSIIKPGSYPVETNDKLTIGNVGLNQTKHHNLHKNIGTFDQKIVKKMSKDKKQIIKQHYGK